MLLKLDGESIVTQLLEKKQKLPAGVKCYVPRKQKKYDGWI